MLKSYFVCDITLEFLQTYKTVSDILMMDFLTHKSRNDGDSTFNVMAPDQIAAVAELNSKIFVSHIYNSNLDVCHTVNCEE